MCPADGLLALGGQPVERPYVRRRVEHAGAAASRLAAELETFLDRGHPVVAGGHHVAMDVDEPHGLHRTGRRWSSAEVRVMRARPTTPGFQPLLGAQVEAERGRVRLQLAERVRFELADALAGDAEQPSDLLERSRTTRR